MSATRAALLGVLVYCIVITVWVARQGLLPSIIANNKHHGRQERIAIIGAGIGGASAALQIHMLTRNLPAQDVTIFEREAVVGGRIKSAYLHPGEGMPKIIEEGATHFFEDDWCVRNAMLEVGLRPSIEFWKYNKNPSRWLDDDARIDLKCNAASVPWQDMLRGRWKDGHVWSEYQAVAQSVLQRWENFASPYQRRWVNNTKQFHRAGLSQEDLGPSLAGLDDITSSAIRNEVTQPCLRGRISQDLTEVSLLAALIAAGKTTRISIDGGNSKLVKRMITLSEADLQLNSLVTKISPRSSRRFRLYLSHLKDRKALEFDTIFIAAPLLPGEIDVRGLNIDIKFFISDARMDAHVTHFSTENRISTNMTLLPLDMSVVEEQTLTTSSMEDRLNVMNLQRSTACFRRFCSRDDDCDVCDENSILYRVHSRRYMKDVYLVRMVSAGLNEDLILRVHGIGYVRRQVWPNSFSSGEGNRTDVIDNMRMRPGLYYLNGAEGILSSMEMSCRMGRNAAYHVINYG